MTTCKVSKLCTVSFTSLLPVFLINENISKVYRKKDGLPYISFSHFGKCSISCPVSILNRKKKKCVSIDLQKKQKKLSYIVVFQFNYLLEAFQEESAKPRTKLNWIFSYHNETPYLAYAPHRNELCSIIESYFTPQKWEKNLKWHLVARQYNQQIPLSFLLQRRKVKVKLKSSLESTFFCNLTCLLYI